MIGAIALVCTVWSCTNPKKVYNGMCITPSGPTRVENSTIEIHGNTWIMYDRTNGITVVTNFPCVVTDQTQAD
jgi:hypothetical protein